MILMSGGEPLMRRDFMDLAEYASSLGIKLVLSTNGTLITKEVARRLRAIGFSYVGISLDSIEEKYHDEFRGVNGAFSLALAGIRNSLSEGLDVGLRFTVTALNIDNVADYVDFAASLGVRRITFYHLSASGRAGRLGGGEWWYTPSQYERFINTIIKYAEKYAGKLEIETTLAPIRCIYIAMKSENPSEYLRFVESTGGCGRKIISIYPNGGDVYPCQFIDFVKLGNVRRNKLRDILVNGLDLFINTEKYLRGGPSAAIVDSRRSAREGGTGRARITWAATCMGGMTLYAQFQAYLMMEAAKSIKPPTSFLASGISSSGTTSSLYPKYMASAVLHQLSNSGLLIEIDK